MKNSHPTKDCVNPKGVGKPLGLYSHAVSVSCERMLFISGQTSVDGKGQVTGKGDAKIQAEQVFKNLEKILKSQGASWDDMLKTTIYLTDIRHMNVVQEVRAKYIKRGYPASTLLVVSGLARPEFLVEVEAVAAL